jgi:hypothetical protein
MNYLKFLGGYASQIIMRANFTAAQRGLPQVFSVDKQLNTAYRIVTRFKWAPPFVEFEIIYHPGKEDEVNLGKF